MRSFEKYIGGSPANIAAGTARLGLKSGLITRVGDEHMGRFIREQLIREGVDVTGVTTSPDRQTALVLLGICDQEQLDFLSRKLRRHGDGRGSHRPRVYRLGRLRLCDRNPSEPPERTGRDAKGAATGP